MFKLMDALSATELAKLGVNKETVTQELKTQAIIANATTPKETVRTEGEQRPFRRKKVTSNPVVVFKKKKPTA